MPLGIISIMTDPRSSIHSRVPISELKLITRRISNAALTLLIIAYLTSFGLILAERGREHLPAHPFDAALQAFIRVWQFVTDHPQIYYWHKTDVPALRLVLDTLLNSVGLLFTSLCFAFFIGIVLGVVAAVSKSKILSALIVMLSTLGISTPSFLLGMLFWVLNIQVHRTFDVTVLPSAGFGWDSHLIMPALVLAMRPLAQIAQVSYVSLTTIVRQDYIRTAYSKGLRPRTIYNRHALTNALIPILTTLGASLRFSLASLPVVELFFDWTGVGLMLLQAIDKGVTFLVIDLILSLGVFFLLVNLVIEIFFPLLDPRLRNVETQTRAGEHSTFIGTINGLSEGLRGWVGDLVSSFRLRRGSSLPPLPLSRSGPVKHDEVPSKRKWIMRAIIKNPSLILGTFLALGLGGLIFWGGQLTKASPYATHGVLTIEGVIQSPPFKPSSVFPWGSDYVGRDIQSLVYNGARQTLSLAFFGMLMRLLLGIVLGILAGWQRGGWFDRLVNGAIGVWAAFPVTLFAMILIQGLGIQQGMWVFIFAISVVGWGEVAQIVHGQVVNIKLQPYIESARSVGARSDQILRRHVLPNLVNPLIVMAALEMGGVMMLLAELGYLGIFMGGGFSAMIAEVGNMQSLVVHFSDVPEWAALIANVRDWWRSNPWMALYPGAAFFVSIMAFNLLGEGLRRFLDESQLNLSHLLNRYTFTAGIAVIAVMSLLLQAGTPLSVYRPEGLKFDAARVQRDIEVLSSVEFLGRETGMLGTESSAQYIAKRMEENGLLPAGEKQTFLQSLVNPRGHLVELPALTLIGSDGKPILNFFYRQDFAEIADANRYGETRGSVMGVAFGPEDSSSDRSDPYGLLNTDARGNVLIVHGADLDKVNLAAAEGILVIADETYRLNRRDLFPYEPPARGNQYKVPTMVISPQLAEMLLASTGSSLSMLAEMEKGLDVNQTAFTNMGVKVEMSVKARQYENLSLDRYINVLGVIPGEGGVLTSEEQVIVVSAYYDGLGIGPNGAFYPGANDNASGVATLIELARIMKASAYKPAKTILFVAWAGGERGEGLSVVNVLNARPGAGNLTVEVVIELSGVGYGTGDSIALQEGSSYRLVKLFQSAAEKYNDPTTTRGRNPHYGREMSVGFGDRRALTLSISWSGSDDLAHTQSDQPQIIDPQKLERVGRTTLLTLMVLARESSY
ncbi:Glutathione transport system permease protein GsiD [Anaerolineales bacterium]|nr:Glutathione transport system permease protein GsiD [Anaerolineales bacterium]